MELESEKKGELSPVRLAEKLKRIRVDNALSQGKMLLIINPTESDETNRARVSQYENGIRVPSLVEVYNYARFAGVTVERLLNDSLDLPEGRQQSDRISKRAKTVLMRNKAKNSKINNGNDSLDANDFFDKDNLPVENKPEPEGNSSFEAETVELSPIQSNKSNTNRSSSSATIYTMHLSKEITDGSKAVFLSLLGELPFDKIGRITPEKFLEQSIIAGLDDYHARRTESALACRMRILFEDESVT